MERLEALYGLPEEVRFCRRCVISNQRPSSTPEFRHRRESKKETIAFDEDGVCAACRYAEEKDEIDWEVREAELRELCARHRRNDGRHDCIVSGSGGKDSVYTSLLLREKYGLHPLTVTWAPHLYTDWGWRNLQAWIGSGFDNVLFTPNGRVHRLLTKLATETLLHPFQPFILGQKNLAPKLALAHEIPLVFYGENEAEYGNPKRDNATALRDWSYFTSADLDEVFLAGVSIAELLGRHALRRVDLAPYLPADPAALSRAKVEVHYLGYYERWHPQSAYYHAVQNGGFRAAPERTPGTYSKYSGIDDKMDDLHFYTTWIKFGIGRATYDAAQEVRNGDITRDEAVALVRRFDGEWPARFEAELFEYLSLDRAAFHALCERFRSPHLWEQTPDGPRLRHTVFAR